eukprot:6220884-Prymnesium_polylepis.1
MQHPKLTVAIQRLKEEPGAYAGMVAEDPELGELFERLQKAMGAKEAEHEAKRANEPPPLKAEEEAEADAAKAEGATAFERGDYAHACARYERAAELQPAVHVHWSNLAVARLRNGEPAAAAAAARRCIERNP